MAKKTPTVGEMREAFRYEIHLGDVRITKAQRDAYAAAIKRSGKKRADWIRDALDRTAQK